jgi:hypothetical protein
MTQMADAVFSIRRRQHAAGQRPVPVHKGVHLARCYREQTRCRFWKNFEDVSIQKQSPWLRGAQLVGTTAILSDGDAVFRPPNVEKSGLWRVFGDYVLIYVH